MIHVARLHRDLERTFLKMPTFLLRSTLIAAALTISSCDKKLETGNDLSKDDKEFITNLGILGADENIILFDSQAGGFDEPKTSGNFFTDKRIASYWIDKHDTTQTSINYAFYEDIDTMQRYPKFRSLTLASYLEVHRRDGTKFKVYVSSDSVGTWKFFNNALEAWNKKRYANKKP